MTLRHQDGRPADLPFWLSRGVAVVLGLLLLGLLLDKLAPRVTTPPPTAAQQEELHRQLDDLQRQSDDLGRRIQEDVKALELRQDAINKAAQVGTPAYVVDEAWDAAQEFGVPVPVFFSLIDRESGWRIDLRHKNDDGSVDFSLTQQNSRYWKPRAQAVGAVDVMNPKDNLRMGAYLLACNFREQGGNWSRALTAYNMGDEGLKNQVASRGTARTAYSDGILTEAGSF